MTDTTSVPVTTAVNILSEILTEQRAAREKAEHTAILVGSINTKITALVGEEGNGGTLGALEERVVSLERFRWMGSGVVFVLGALFAMLRYLFPIKQ